jgi:hypothetical protein
MELTTGEDPVILNFPESYVNYPTWFKNIVDHIAQDDTLKPGMVEHWFRIHYGVEFASHLVIFPNNETFVECVIAWS